MGRVDYTYNDVGLRTAMTVAGETPVSYSYDAANRLLGVTQGTFSSSLFYDDAGRRTRLVLPNGINVLYFYDKASRLTNITYLAAVTNRIDYAYDSVGNRVVQSSALALYILPSAISTSSYNAANQQLVFGSYRMLYDANGNVTNIVSGTTTNRLFWNGRNQLTNITGAVSASFVYDGLGRRVTRKIGTGITEQYLYDGLDIILMKDGSNKIRTRYFRGLAIDEPWQRIDFGTKRNSPSTNRVYMADALGSIVALTDPNQNITTEYDYEPFGKSIRTGLSTLNSYTFTAREDDSTGLYFYRARYYHPALGRFVSEDPLEFIDGPNFYLYVANNPINRTDPSGLKLYKCTTPTWGGSFTHAYLYSDTLPEPNNRCERQSSSSGRYRTRRAGDAKPLPADRCVELGVSDSVALEIIRCCQQTAHSKPWVPGVTDCHNVVDDCLKKFGLVPPAASRFAPKDKECPIPCTDYDDLG